MLLQKIIKIALYYIGHYYQFIIILKQPLSYFISTAFKTLYINRIIFLNINRTTIFYRNFKTIRFDADKTYYKTKYYIHLLQVLACQRGIQRNQNYG